MDINYKDTRISKLRDYLFQVIDSIVKNKKYQINADMLGKDVESYSLDKIPNASTVERWITGLEIHRDIFSFRSRKAYSQDTINNLTNIGFFEIFEASIKNNNDNKILPDIKGIESISCLNCGTMNNANTNTAEFDIQIQITYREEK